MKTDRKRLFHRLAEYGKEDVYPFHMPGHKRNPAFASGFLPVGQDITEITGFDDLHHAEGLIRDAQERTARLYGSREVFFSVNGSTAAILSALSAAAGPGEKVLIARNSHRSAYHALYLRNLSPVYVYPSCDPESGINGGISPEEIRRALARDPEIRAVFLTSPTYDGVVSDIRSAALAAHEKGIPLIVDEAHGAHFSFSDYFPESAVRCGADLVIQSVHKTLPCLTQAAVLHRCSELVRRERIADFMRIYQTSSPSYLLMSSMDACMEMLEQKGEERFRKYTEMLEAARKKLSANEKLRLITPERKKENGVFDFDRSKLILGTAGTSFTGPSLLRILHEEYRLEMEMASSGYVIALSSVGDTEEGFDRLVNAVRELDRRAGSAEMRRSLPEIGEWPVMDRKLSEALDGPSVTVPFAESEGRVSAEFIYLYPPGTPLLVPGERITGHLIRNVRRYSAEGLKVSGIRDHTMERIEVAKE